MYSMMRHAPVVVLVDLLERRLALERRDGLVVVFEEFRRPKLIQLAALGSLALRTHHVELAKRFDPPVHVFQLLRRQQFGEKAVAEPHGLVRSI
jgi:hypothetical protein